MNKMKENRMYPTKGRRALFGVVVAFMTMGMLFLAACDNNAMDADLTEAATVTSLSKAVISENTQRGEGRRFSRRNGEHGFSREDFIRWAEERGYSREDLKERHIWREYRQARGETFNSVERHHYRFDRENKGERRFERRPRAERG